MTAETAMLASKPSVVMMIGVRAAVLAGMAAARPSA